MVVVVDSVLVPGVAVEVVVVVELLEEDEPPAGDGFTTVVLFSVFFSAGGVTVSDFCSQAASNAAPASMQMIFFIGRNPLWVTHRIDARLDFGLAAFEKMKPPPIARKS